MASEWILDINSFQRILNHGFHPQVDFFATKKNSQLQTFVSPVVDNQAFTLDAFSISWNQWKTIYLFPPSSQILKNLKTLEAFQGTAIFITPKRPNQP